jgi:hypothetical protein
MPAEQSESAAKASRHRRGVKAELRDIKAALEGLRADVRLALNSEVLAAARAGERAEKHS